MQRRGPWQTPRLEKIGTTADLTKGKAMQGTDAFCGSPPEVFCPPKFPPIPGAEPERGSTDAIIR